MKRIVTFSMLTGTLLVMMLLINGSFLGSAFALTAEGDYSSYSIITNSTTDDGWFDPPGNIKLSDTGSVFFRDHVFLYIFSSSANQLMISSNTVQSIMPQYFDQSETGMYRVFINNNSTGDIKIYKNDALLQTITLDPSQFEGDNLSSLGIAISPAAQYITIIGQDSTIGNYKIETFQGS